MKRSTDDTGGEKKVWRPPTRRAFVAMLGAAAASLALRDQGPKADPPRSTSNGTTRWIGHC